MAQTPEGRVKARVAITLKEMGIWYFMPPANGYGRAGIPDFIGCMNGGLIAIEAKAGKNKPTALQLRELERIQAAGGLSLVIDESNITQLKEILEKWVRNRWLPGADE